MVVNLTRTTHIAVVDLEQGGFKTLKKYLSNLPKLYPTRKVKETHQLHSQLLSKVP